LQDIPSAIKETAMNRLPMLDTDQLAELIRVSPDTCRYWRHIGKGPKYFKMGGRKVYYRQEDVDAWLEEQYGNVSRPEHSIA
jgi:predicted DNA-binding transcriptional regulator AlpA